MRAQGWAAIVPSPVVRRLTDRRELQCREYRLSWMSQSLRVESGGRAGGASAPSCHADRCTRPIRAQTRR